MAPSNKGRWEEVRGRLNQILRAWSAYFSNGTRATGVSGGLRATFMRAYGISYEASPGAHTPNVLASQRCSASWEYCNSARIPVEHRS